MKDAEHLVNQYITLLQRHATLAMELGEVRLQLEGEVALFEWELLDTCEDANVRRWWNSVRSAASFVYIAEILLALDSRGASLAEFKRAVQIAGTWDLQRVVPLIDTIRGLPPADSTTPFWRN